MKEFNDTFFPELPEQCKVSFTSTGLMGGDSGHGANASLVFSENGSNMNIQVDLYFQNGNQESFSDLKEISITTFGDWEVEGLAKALIDLGEKLSKN
ncbi:MAG: hypothetical protein PHI97_00705 [Desulfobulbus sp.]|nr:hypothetical protein [Desulfobulbus sp.]